MHRSKGNVVNTVLRRHRLHPVIIFSQQSSDSKPSMPKVLDVKVRIFGALQCAPMYNFHLHLPNAIQFGDSSATPCAWKGRPPASFSSTHCPVILIFRKYMSAHWPHNRRAFASTRSNAI